MPDMPEAELPVAAQTAPVQIHRRRASASPVLVSQGNLPEVSSAIDTRLGTGRQGMQAQILRPIRRTGKNRNTMQRTPAEREAEASYFSGLVDHTRVDCERAETWLAYLPVTCDLIFGSPPYTNARKYKDSDGSEARLFKDAAAWAAWMADIYTLCLEKCRGLVAFVVAGNTKRFAYNCSPYLLVAELQHRGICVRNPWVFHRKGIAGSGGPDYFRSDYELVVPATRGGKLPWSHNTAMGRPPVCGPGGAMSHRMADGSRTDGGRNGATRKRRGNDRDQGTPKAGRASGYRPPKIANPGNVFYVPVGGGLMGHKLAHENEAPFPERLAEIAIRSFCPPGGVVGDPFLGSGTTAAVAKKTGRIGIGCDLRQNQCRIARERLGSVVWQSSLKPEQPCKANGEEYPRQRRARSVRRQIGA